MGDETHFSPDHHVRHDATCDGCHDTIFGIRHQCQTCPDWNYCNNCIAQAPRKHALHEFALIHNPLQARDTTAVRGQALDFGRLETRFLTIGPSPPSFSPSTAESIRVSCELGIRSLYKCPKYIALSYSWGEHGSTRPVLLDGRIIQVTTSLEVALQELIARGVTIVWVDALCIDQGNDYEKVYQLRHMGTIFSKAKKVIAWLGPAAEDSDNAMQALETIREFDDAGRHDAAILQLLKRPYWVRVWIIQELAKASRAEVWCGKRMLSWRTFFKCAQKWLSTSELWASDFDHPILTLKYFCNEERKSRMGAARILLSAAMVRTLHTRATLKRDRVYALLGITRDGTETVPTPNYVQSDEQIFNAIMKHMIVEQGQLDLMFLAGLGRKKGSSPSWLPAWDSEMPLQANPWVTECFSFPFDSKKTLTCRDDVLHVNAKVLGQIQSGPELPLCPAVSLFAEMLLQIARYRLVTAGYDLSKDTWHDLWPPLDAHARELGDLLLSAEKLEQPKNLEHFDRKAFYLKAHKRRVQRAQSISWYITLLEHRVWDPHLDSPSISSTHRLRRASHVSLQDRFMDDSPKPLRRTYSVSSQKRIQDLFPKFPLWISRLEASVAKMLRHGVKLYRLPVDIRDLHSLRQKWFKYINLGHQSRDRREQYRFVILPQFAQETDFIALVANCSLPVVIRNVGGGRYSVLGEMVDRYIWEKPGRVESLPSRVRGPGWGILHLV
jgi:hypothetical protein